MKRRVAGSRMLVTGASSGIGRALAELAARRGARLVLAALSEDAIARSDGAFARFDEAAEVWTLDAHSATLDWSDRV
jgi:NAD(P)-dependent dehydrogenase (short-subunit alcohol dehydrogenase family)